MKRKRKILFLNALFFLVAPFFFSPPSQGMTYFFVDSDWNGSKTGSEKTPWKYLDASAWAKINGALQGDDVTVYFSAREAKLDVDDTYDVDGDRIQDGIELNNRSDAGNHYLILDGGSKYNTNDLSPAWQSYVGASKCKIRFINSQNTSHVKRSRVVIDGFRIEQNSRGKAVAICGDEWTVRNCDIYNTLGASDGPLVFIVSTADGAHEGSNSYCEASRGINIENNRIHDSYGELIYVGGAGCSQYDASGEIYCAGFPSHSDITIKKNTIYNGGRYGAEGDGIDLKAGLTNVTITGNEIVNTGPSARAIVTQGQKRSGQNQNYIIEKNYIHDCTRLDDAAIAIVNGWGTPKGMEVRNNIIVLNKGVGIKIYDGFSLAVYNNTIYKNSSNGIIVSKGEVGVINNLLIDNNGGGNQASLFPDTTISEYNGYSNSWGGTCGTCVPGLMRDDLVDVTNSNFSLSNNSTAIDNGKTLQSFSDDYAGRHRPLGPGWDIGAFEGEWRVSVLSPPKNVRILQ